MAPRTLAVRWSRVLVVAALASGCAHPAASKRPSASAEARAEIEAANAEFAKALVRGDAHAMAALFTEDGQIVPAMQKGFVSGRPEIEAYQAKRLQARRYVDAAITTQQLEVSGDVAWELGTNRLTIQQGETAPLTVTGRYLAVWKRGADGTWRIRADLPIADPVE